MTIPAAMFIEQAEDFLKTYPKELLDREIKEFKVALGDRATEEVIKGYILGIATARCLLMQMPKAIRAGVEI